MFNLFKKKPVPAGPDTSSIVPRIKVGAFLTVFDTMNVPADQRPFTEPLAGGLLVTYAFDQPHTFQMMNGNDLTRLGLTADQVKPIALTNLRRLMPQIGVAEQSPVHRIAVGNNLEACTLLAGTFWQRLADQATGNVVAVAPSRDHVLFCDSCFDEGIQALGNFAAEMMETEQQHALSDQLIEWREGRWVDYTP
jgi:uncharacterized protein YtpQ (UPF0354 family)